MHISLQLKCLSDVYVYVCVCVCVCALYLLLHATL